MFHYLGGLFLGWSLGANDSANIFGTAIESRMVRFRTAAILGSIFIVLGATLEGREGIQTLQGLTSQTLATAVICSFGTAIAVTLMTIFKIPVSTSQAMVGSIIGLGIMQNELNVEGLGKVVACWISTPIGGMVIAVLLYTLLKKINDRLNLTVFSFDPIVRMLLIAGGCYGAYALGANNVANVVGVFVGTGKVDPQLASFLGGLAITSGLVTFSRSVMMTVGKGIVRLNAFSALVALLAHSITLHLYAKVGVPVSSSQAIVGAVLGIGVVKGLHTVNRDRILRVFSGWITTPAIAGFVTIVIYAISHLRLEL
jgi:PiT family inorganic phosphate transporter